MTREEAIICLNMIDFTNGQCTLHTWRRGIDDEMRSAIEMAIKALDQEPVYYPPCEDCHKKMDAIRNAYDKLQQPCEDAISRQAVLDLIADYDLSMGQVVRGIHALPSVTPQQKIGRWIPVSERLPNEGESRNTFLVTDSEGKLSLSKFYLPLQNSVINQPYWSGMIDVVAWMPLFLEPYRKETEDD